MLLSISIIVLIILIREKCIIYTYPHFRCIAAGKADVQANGKNPDGENSMFFDMDPDKTLCHCIGPITPLIQSPLGGKCNTLQTLS